MASFFKFIDENFIFPARYNRLAKKLTPYLTDCKTVLDLGASCGRLAHTISRSLPKIKFTGVDIIVQPETFIPIKKYDGKKLPFKNSSFDCVMIIDVLHHDKRIDEVIKEAKRVSKKHILIKDHYWDNKFDFKVLKYADYMGNRAYGVELPYNFLKIEKWKSIFKENNLKIIEQEKYRDNLLNPIKHVIFKLKV